MGILVREVYAHRVRQLKAQRGHDILTIRRDQGPGERVLVLAEGVVMRVWAIAIASIFALVLCGSAAHGLLLPQPGPAAKQGENPATTPAARDEPWWMERHQQIVSSMPQHTDTQLLMIGDSITNNYDKAKPPDENFLPTWQQYYEPRKALNLGFSGDTTANVLWRIEHGEVDGLHPRATVVLIGTNNTGWKQQTAVVTEAGIDAVVKELRHRLPQMQILLLGILPSDLEPSKVKADQDVNRYLAEHYAHQPYVHYLDIGQIFFKDGRLDTTMFYDPRLKPPGHALHPDSNGQRKMAEAIEPLLSRLMHDAPTH